MTILDDHQKRILRLIARDGQAPDGWCSISAVVYPLVQNTMPADLVEHQPTEFGRGRARLTSAGHVLLKYF